MLQWFDKLDATKKALTALVSIAVGSFSVGGAVAAMVVTAIRTPALRLGDVESRQTVLTSEVAEAVEWQQTHDDFVRDSVITVLRGIRTDLRQNNCLQRAIIRNMPRTVPADELLLCGSHDGR